MKKFFYSIFLVGFALMSASCRKVDEKSIDLASGDLTVTASIVDFDGTRMSYDFTTEGLKASWEEGDRIFGFDNTGVDFTYTVTGFDNNNNAIFTGDYSAGKGATILYAIYYPGKSVMDIEDETLSVDLSSQNGTLNTSIPAIMCATANINGGKVNFVFSNQTAIVGVSQMTLNRGNNPVANESITDITLHNVATKGTIKIVEDENGYKLKLEAETDKSYITAKVDLKTNEEGKLTISNTPYFAVIPMTSSSEENINLELTASNAGNEYSIQEKLPLQIIAGRYYLIGNDLNGNVAQIGENSYSSLTSAITAASSTSTITMIGDDNEDCEIVSGKNITLDLNGHTITGCITVKSGGELTVKDETENGKITNTNANCIKVEAGGSLTLNGGTVEGDGSNDEVEEVPVYVIGSQATVGSTIATFNGGKIVQKGDNKKGALYVTKSTVRFPKQSKTHVLNEGIERAVYAATGVILTIEGGKFEAKTGKSIFLNNGGGDNNPIQINGGEFIGGEAECVLLYNKKTYVKITGGRFKWKTDNDFCLLGGDEGSMAEKGQITVSGGYYVKDISNDNVTISSDFSCQALQDVEGYTHKVSPTGTIIAKIEDTEYTSVESAFQAANSSDSDCKITLLGADSPQQTINLSNSNAEVTLDLNGQTLTGQIVVGNGGRLVVEDETGNGEITNTSNCIKVEAGGSLTLNGGKITLKETTEDNALLIEGGTVTFPENSSIEIESPKYTVCAKQAAKLEIYGGAVTSTSTTGGCPLVLDGCTEPVKIYGGTFEGNNFSEGLNNSEAKNIVEIYGGDFNYSNNFRGTGSATIGIVVSGGRFSKNLSTTTYVKEGYDRINIQADPYFYQVVSNSGEALLDNERTTFTLAVNGANTSSESCTIKLIQDVTVSDPITINNSNAKVILDLNGYTLNGQISSSTEFEITDSSMEGTGKVVKSSDSDTDDANDYAVKVDGANGNFTLSGGTLEAKNYVIDVRGTKTQPAKAKIVNGKINAVGADGGSSAIYSYYGEVTSGDETSDGTINVKAPRVFRTSTSSKVTIYKGTYTVSGSASNSSMFFLYDTNSKIEIRGGIFNSCVAPQFFTYNSDSVNPTVNIFGGNFSWRLAFAKPQHTNLSITGGTFISDVSNNCAANSGCEGPDSNGKYNVVNGIIKVDEVYCTTVEDAKNKINKAPSGVTVKLLKDVSLGALTIEKK